ncbi:hypothetical protein P8H26_09105 [Pseudochrobactrum sp. sp1633]|uniref:hypothetical protein n=1 Tax=Pseudochrobactrum sp. sp1633 TaxID=3036706 RepID=UPI0025A6278F|nr:hypothetical protein [Pseudochrobactrum sp. sp1633]MDM8345551.1 hypothetical protein [Pseudochrobactrum sp. sp1633]HWD13178.1 hypothetical protein [Pseudochrobactrum sp.]
MSLFSLHFSPLLSPLWLSLCLVPLALVVLAGLALRKRGSLLRLGGFAALALALFNPEITREQREPLKTIVGVVVDRSASQSQGNRTQDTDAALDALKKKLSSQPDIETRIIESATGADDRDNTRLFTALNEGLRDVPPSRIGGAVMITDGQVHDAPASADELNFKAPLHALITGTGDEFDRSIRFVRVPRFGLSGKPQELVFRVEDAGKVPADAPQANVTIRINGEPVATLPATSGQDIKTEITLPHAGRNIVEIVTEPLDDEVTAANNQAVALIDAIRENLRVLLVSGEPNNGERTWRNLLKSDTSVDLVHFTILRPPEKQDDTPINELSLIVFPTRELFVDKVEDFDLIIFDRYQHRNVLPLLYYDYIAQYVQNGGALLIAAGPEYAGSMSIARTPLLGVLPALPTGSMTEKGFYPRLTDAGKRHPVTRGLEGSAQEPPQWGRWFRSIDIATPQGETVMQGPDNKPLMVLGHQGKGRVGMLLSDQGWLWARDFEGGGPYASLYRRMAHWLMQEPELEEEALTAKGTADRLQITRQTMSDKVNPAKVTTPSGKVIEVPLAQSLAGQFTAELPVSEQGLYKVENGDYSVLTHVGNVETPELRDSISTTQKLLPMAQASGGNVLRLKETKAENNVTVPDIALLSASQKQSPANVLGLRPTQDTSLVAVHRIPLFTSLLALAALLLILGGTWYREGR